MDPNATLETILANVATILADDASSELATELAEHVEALDKWIYRGGFLPSRWAD